MCKQRYHLIKRKAIYTGDPHAAEDDSSKNSTPNSKRRKLDPSSSSAATTTAAAAIAAAAAGGGATTNAAAAAAAAAGGGGGDSNSNANSSPPPSPKGRLDGVVLETKRVAARDQVYVYEGDDAGYANFLATLRCMVCGGDENEEHLLICDGELVVAAKLSKPYVLHHKLTGSMQEAGITPNNAPLLYHNKPPTQVATKASTPTV